MSQVRLPHIDSFRDRNGTMRHYFRVGHGKRTRLPGDVGSTAFLDAYLSLKTGAQSIPPSAQQPADGSFDQLAAIYFSSSAFRSLSDESKPGYKSVINRILRQNNVGRRLVSEMRNQDAEKLMATYEGKPGAARQFLSKFGVLIDLSIKLGWRKDNPLASIHKPKLGSHRKWSDDECLSFEARWPIGTIERAAYELLLSTGQRRGDVARMQWSHLSEGTIFVKQKKTGKELYVPVLPRLKLALDAARRQSGCDFILLNVHGEGMTPSCLGRTMADAIGAAGLPNDCVAHGLRKTAACKLADAGCSTKEIQAITGHSSLSEVERYTKEAEQKKLARSAMTRWQHSGLVTTD